MSALICSVKNLQNKMSSISPPGICRILCFVSVACFAPFAWAQPASPSGDFKLSLPLAERATNPCSENKLQQGGCGSIPTSETIKKDTGETVSFFDTQPARIVSGIESAQILGGKLVLKVATKGLFLEYAGPVVDTIQKTTYAASPICSAIVHTLTLGIFLVLKPVDSTQIALGCTDEKVTQREVNAVRSKPTGREQWKEWSAKHRIVVSGVGADRSFDVIFNGLNGLVDNFNIDLISLIAGSSLDGVDELTVKCVTCEGVGEKDVAGIPSISDAVTVDLKSTRDGMRLADKVQQELQAKLAEERRQASEREKAEIDRIAREGDGSLDDLACKKRKLKPSTPAYLKCREALVKEQEEQMRAVAEKDEKNRLEEAKKEEARLSRQRITSGQEDRSALGDAKQKCVDLGFKPATEKFGQCVLRLSK